MRTLRPALLVRPQCTMDEASNALMLKQLNEVFWKNKKALVEAELNQKMRDLEEYQAREAALYESLMAPALPSAAAVPAIAAGGNIAALQAELDAEKQRTAALEAELEAVRMKSEVELQKVAAFWCVARPMERP